MVGARSTSIFYRENIQMRTVTNSQILEKLESLEDRITKLEETINKGKGAISFMAGLGGIAAIVGGYFISK